LKGMVGRTGIRTATSNVSDGNSFAGSVSAWKINGGDDGARTRDLRRDRPNVSPLFVLHAFVFQILMDSAKAVFGVLQWLL